MGAPTEQGKCQRHRRRESMCNPCNSDWDNRPHKTEGHAWFCDCGKCMGDGNESQWHRMCQPHPNCPQTGGWWPADHDPYWTCSGVDCEAHKGYQRSNEPARTGPPPWV